MKRLWVRGEAHIDASLLAMYGEKALVAHLRRVCGEVMKVASKLDAAIIYPTLRITEVPHSKRNGVRLRVDVEVSQCRPS